MGKAIYIHIKKNKVRSLELRYREKNEEIESLVLGIFPMISGSTVLQK